MSTVQSTNFPELACRRVSRTCERNWKCKNTKNRKPQGRGAVYRWVCDGDPGNNTHVWGLGKGEMETLLMGVIHCGWIGRRFERY